MFLKAAGLLSPAPQEGSKEMQVADIRSGEFGRDPHSIVTTYPHTSWVERVATVLSTGGPAVKKACETPPL